jgi:hypothetical protein
VHLFPAILAGAKAAPVDSPAVERKMAWIDIAVSVAQNPPAEKEIKQVRDNRARRATGRFHADENFPALATKLVRGMGARVQTNQKLV